MNREPVEGVTDDVGVNMLREMKPSRHPARARVRIVIGDGGNARSVGESNSYRGGTPLHMRRPRERRGSGRRGESSSEKNALGVRRPETWLRPIEVVESVKNFFGDRRRSVGFGWCHLPTMLDLPNEIIPPTRAFRLTQWSAKPDTTFEVCPAALSACCRGSRLGLADPQLAHSVKERRA